MKALIFFMIMTFFPEAAIGMASSDLPNHFHNSKEIKTFHDNAPIRRFVANRNVNGSKKLKRILLVAGITSLLIFGIVAFIYGAKPIGIIIVAFFTLITGVWHFIPKKDKGISDFAKTFYLAAIGGNLLMAAMIAYFSSKID